MCSAGFQGAVGIGDGAAGVVVSVEFDVATHNTAQCFYEIIDLARVRHTDCIGDTESTPIGGDIVSSRLDRTLPNRSPEAVVQTGERVGVTRFSPDGQWLVYVADSGDSRSAGIFVQPFRRPGLRTQVAQSKGELSGFPEWRKDGKEIVYLTESDFWSVSVENQKGALRFGPPQKLFSGFRRPAGITIASRPFAVSRDGSKIYAVQGIEQPDTNMIHVKMMRETEAR